MVTKKDGSTAAGDRVVETRDGYMRVKIRNGATVIPKSDVKSVAGGEIEDAEIKKT